MGRPVQAPIASVIKPTSTYDVRFPSDMQWDASIDAKLDHSLKFSFLNTNGPLGPLPGTPVVSSSGAEGFGHNATMPQIRENAGSVNPFDSVNGLPGVRVVRQETNQSSA